MNSAIYKGSSLIIEYFLVISYLIILLGPTAHADLYNDGGVHYVIDDKHYDEIVVDEPPPPLPAYTTLTFGTAGVMTIVDSLGAYNNSRVTQNGGHAHQFSAYGNSTATINDGIVEYFEAHDNSQATINGGDGGYTTVHTYDNSQATINDGVVGYFEARDNSQVTINGGNIMEYFFASENSQVTVNGGAVSMNGFKISGNSRATLNGGSITEYLSVRDNGQVTINYITTQISGGGVTVRGNGRVTMNDGITGKIWAHDNSQVILNGGEVIGPVHAFDNSTVTVKGGDISKGDYGCHFGASDNGLVTIYGSDFYVYSDYELTDLLFSGYGFLDSTYGGCYLTGTLASGDSNRYYALAIEDNGQIYLTPVPGAVLLGILGLSVAGIKLRKYE